MDNQTKSSTKPQFSPYQEGVKKALKQAGEQQTMDALQQGVPAQHIEQQSGLSQEQLLDQILTLSKKQVAAKAPADGGLMSGRVGLIGGLINAVQGQGFNPMAQKTESIGFDNAAQVLGLQQTMQKNSMDAQKFPMEMQQMAGNQAVQEQTYNQNAVMNPLNVQKTQQEIDAGKPENKLAFEREKAKIKSNDGSIAESAASTAKSLNEIRSRIWAKGPGLGQAGKLATGIGIGTEARSEYEFNAEAFVFQIGNLLDQRGKAFVGDEQKMVKERMMKGLSENEGSFRGSMRGVARLVNHKAGYDMMTIGKDGKININEKAYSKQGGISSFSDPEKEARYQAWKATQGA